MTHVNSIKEAIENAAPATQNNTRQIIREAHARFKRNRSELHGNYLERLTGVGYDFADSDWGNGPRGENEQ